MAQAAQAQTDQNAAAETASTDATTTDKPVAKLVPDDDAKAAPKRRGRPPGGAKRGSSSAAKTRRNPKASKKSAKPDILFLVETEEGSEQYEMQEISTAEELLDLMDENRKLVAARQWREL